MGAKTVQYGGIIWPKDDPLEGFTEILKKRFGPSAAEFAPAALEPPQRKQGAPKAGATVSPGDIADWITIAGGVSFGFSIAVPFLRKVFKTAAMKGTIKKILKRGKKDAPKRLTAFIVHDEKHLDSLRNLVSRNGYEMKVLSSTEGGRKRESGQAPFAKRSRRGKVVRCSPREKTKSTSRAAARRALERQMDGLVKRLSEAQEKLDLNKCRAVFQEIRERQEQASVVQHGVPGARVGT